MQADPQQAHGVKKTLFWVIWGALCVSMLIYVLLISQVLNRGVEQQPRDMGNLGMILMAVSAAMALGSVAIFQMALSRTRLAEQMTADPTAALNRAFPFYVICWVMNESICIFGFVLSIMTVDSSRIYPFFAAGLLLNLAMYPRFSR